MNGSRARCIASDDLEGLPRLFRMAVPSHAAGVAAYRLDATQGPFTLYGYPMVYCVYTLR